MNPEIANNSSQMNSTPTQVAESPKKCKNKNLALIIVLTIFAIGGIGFGGFELLQNIKNNQTKTPTTLLSLDKGNSLGEKLYEQIQKITAHNFCGSKYHPLYDLSEDEYITKYEDLSNSTKFEIIAERIPEITALEKDGEGVTVSGERMEEVFDSVFGDREDVAYGVFGFIDSSSDESAGIHRTHLFDYDIERIENDRYIISLKKEPIVNCEMPRYHFRYEYIGLSNTINNQLLNNVKEDTQAEKAMIVLEKKTIDYTTENNEEYSDGYYGVLFIKHNEDFFWIGTYYLGDTVEQ